MDKFLHYSNRLRLRPLSFRTRLALLGLGLLVSLLVWDTGLTTQAAGTDGTLDTTFNPGGAGANNGVSAVAVQSDGKILIGGYFTTYNGTSANYIARLNTDGTLDTTFNPGGAGASNNVYAVTVQSDGKILIGGAFNSYNGTTISGIARLNTDGTLDTSFNPGGAGVAGTYSSLSVVAVQSDGKILIGGYFTSYNGTTANNIARLNTDGTLDTSFNPGGAGIAGGAHDVTSGAVQNDGKMLIGGLFTSYNGTAVPFLIRLNSNGSLDNSFNMGGSGPDSVLNAIIVQSDGKILIGGAFNSYNGTTISGIARLNTDGTLDTSFNPGGAGISLAGGGSAQLKAMAVQSDGKILIGGAFNSYNGTTISGIARLNTDGTLDTSFNPGGAGASNKVYAVVVQSDGKILIGGGFNSYNGTTAKYLARLNNTIIQASSTNLTSSHNPSTFGQSVTFTATVSPIAATGTVSFTFDTGSTVTTTLTTGSATYMTSTLPVGSHIITATYSGDSTYATSFTTTTQVVNKAASAITLTSDLNPSTVGQSVSFTATVSPNSAGGTVNYTFDGGTSVSATVSGGVATYVTSTLTAGSHSVVASYAGDSSYASSTSNTLTQTVNLNSSSISLSSSPNPSLVGQSVTFTATLSPISASGTVTFSEGSQVLGTAQIMSGTAVYTTSSLSVGSHVITATYSGDNIYAGAASPPLTQLVQSPCAPLVVTAITDDGTGTSCGTLSYALSQPITGSTGVTITFALTQGHTITFTGSLTTTAKVKAGVTIYGGAFGSPNRVILNGNGVAGDGLHLVGHDKLVNLTIQHFLGRELVQEGTGNRLQGVVVVAAQGVSRKSL